MTYVPSILGVTEIAYGMYTGWFFCQSIFDILGTTSNILLFPGRYAAITRRELRGRNYTFALACRSVFAYDMAK